MEGLQCLSLIRERFKDDSLGFEQCAADLVSKLDPHFEGFTFSREWQDGGRDTAGRYRITTGGTVHPDVRLSAALEARCYEAEKGVEVSEMTRLISRTERRNLGVMVTTGYISEPAYREAIDGKHKILILTATDIARILRDSGHGKRGARLARFIGGEIPSRVYLAVPTPKRSGRFTFVRP